MHVKTTRVVSALVGMSALLAGARSARCEVPFLLRPIVNVGRMTATTTSQVAKASVSAVTTVVKTPKTLYVKVNNVINSKKSK